MLPLLCTISCCFQACLFWIRATLFNGFCLPLFLDLRLTCCRNLKSWFQPTRRWDSSGTRPLDWYHNYFVGPQSIRGHDSYAFGEIGWYHRPDTEPQSVLRAYSFGIGKMLSSGASARSAQHVVGWHPPRARRADRPYRPASGIESVWWDHDAAPNMRLARKWRIKGFVCRRQCIVWMLHGHPRCLLDYSSEWIASDAVFHRPRGW